MSTRYPGRSVEAEGMIHALDDLSHYVNKTAIAANLLDGTPATALCGEVLDSVKRPSGGAGASPSLVCPMCSALYSILPAGKDDE